MTQRAKQKAATRERILAAAKVLFAKHGARGVSIREIADAADVSTGALYVSWSGIDALFREAIGRPIINDENGAKLFAALETIADQSVPAGILTRDAMQQVAVMAISAFRGISEGSQP